MSCSPFLERWGVGGGRTLDTVLLLDLGCRLLGLVFPCVVPYRDVGAGFCEGLGHGQSDPGTGTRDDGRLALEGEEREDAVGLGRRGGVVGELAVLHVRHFWSGQAVLPEETEIGMKKGSQRRRGGVITGVLRPNDRSSRE